MTRPGLAAITALLRSGALDRAWALFEVAGYAESEDSAALAVKGRLLKERAVRRAGAEREALLAGAEAAYAAAHASSPAPYLLINVAALASLRGDAPRAEMTAGEVLEILDAPGLAETPYYVAATRAEALLLRRDQTGAAQALTEAVALHPMGWEEVAGTIRQLRLILESRGEDAAWLDAYRPPTSLHYAGHLGVAPTGTNPRTQIDSLLAQERIGAGFGAIAAGADILVAEALLARGVALHLVLPGRVDAFAAYSVAPYGETWLPRFHACLERATSLRIAARSNRAHEPLATALAAETAMGGALLHARRYETRAVQLLIVDEGTGPFGTGANTARDAATWAATGNAQHIMRWPRDGGAAAPPAPPPDDRRLMAALLVYAGDAGLPGEDDFASWYAEVLIPLRTAWPQVIPHGNALLLGFATPAEAAEAALKLHAMPLAARRPLRIAGAYGIVHAEGGLTGTPVAMAEALAAIAQPGVTSVTDLFASALAVHSRQDRAEWIGDHDLPGLAEPTGVFVLTR